MIVGAMVAAFFGAALAGRLSEDRLQRVILCLLSGIGGSIRGGAELAPAWGEHFLPVRSAR